MTTAYAQTTLEQVRARGSLRCGVDGDLPGFSDRDPSGRMTGFDADFCRVIAAAVFGDAEAVTFVEVTNQGRFQALQDETIDVLIRNTTWTSSRDTRLELNFVQTTFFDGQGILARADRNINRLADLAGGSVCVTQGTTTERNLADSFAQAGVDYTAIIFIDTTLAARALEQGLCDAFTSDRSALPGLRARFENPQNYIILEEALSKEPLGPSVRHGDDQWFDIVQWAVHATIQAEEWGVRSDNIVFAAENTVYRSVKLFLGEEEGLYEDFGLGRFAMRDVIAQVGNYAEIYNRHLGPDTPTEIPRGLNRLWTEGGILYAPPFSPR
ncbi:MAG: amino acid ABC transporter substrate-binding protein [Trueperaceae bacterium]|nr:amino acid ABC transporter substrate-binding protein [Trueperaceae bacterium]